MAVFDAIAALPIVNFSNSFNADFAATPTVSFDGQQVTFAENTAVQLYDVTAIYENDLVNFPVDIGNNEFYDVSMRLIATQPAFVFQLESASPIEAASKPVNIATFSYQTNQLTIPSTLLDSSTLINGVKMTLSNAQSLQFTVTGSD